jgi:hypothetical protein
MDTTKEQPSLELWLHEVQSYIYKLTSGPMKQARFNFNRTGFNYNRKNKKSEDELSVIFLSQFPVKYRVGFQLEVWHTEIKRVKESFMREILTKESNLCSIILYTKNFPSNDPNQAFVKDYTIYNHQDLFMVADWLAQTFQDELVPLCNALDSIEHMDTFFEANPNWTINTHSGGNVCTELIVTKLNRKRDFHLRYQQLIQGIQEKIESKQMNPDSRELLTLCYETIK